MNKIEFQILLILQQIIEKAHIRQSRRAEN